MAKDINPFADVQDKPIEGSLYGSQLSNIATLQAGAGDKVMRADESGLWLGASEFASAPFRVDMSGNVYASSLTASGYISVGGAAADVNANATTVDGGKITALSVTATQIAAGAITTAKISAGAITANEIASNAITAAKINADAVTASKIQAGAVSASKLDSDVISGGLIVANLLSASRITTGTLNASLVSVTNLNASNITTGTLSASYISGGTLNIGGSEGSYISVRNSSNTEIARINTSGIIVRNTRGLFFEQTTGGSYWDLSVNSSNQAVMSLPTTNQFFITNYAGDTNLFTVSSTQTYSENKIVANGGIEMNNNTIYEISMANFNETSTRPNDNDGIWYYKSGGSYAFRSRMEGGNWQFDQSAA